MSVFAATPLAAWEFSPTPVCTLTQPTENGDVKVTFDPATGDYAIALQLAQDVWLPSDQFSIAFIGPAPLRIATGRHVLSDDKKTLSVTDTGFGNVLEGMARNQAARAVAGDTVLVIPLDGAAQAVAAFRACPADALS